MCNAYTNRACIIKQYTFLLRDSAFDVVLTVIKKTIRI